MLKMTKESWKRKVEEDVLQAFTEHMCRRIAQVHDLDIYRANILEEAEILLTCTQINRYFTAFKCLNVQEAFSEILEECDPASRILQAREHVAYYSPDKRREILATTFDTMAEFKNFLKRYIKHGVESCALS